MKKVTICTCKIAKVDKCGQLAANGARKASLIVQDCGGTEVQGCVLGLGELYENE